MAARAMGACRAGQPMIDVVGVCDGVYVSVCLCVCLCVRFVRVCGGVFDGGVCVYVCVRRCDGVYVCAFVRVCAYVCMYVCDVACMYCATARGCTFVDRSWAASGS